MGDRLGTPGAVGFSFSLEREHFSCPQSPQDHFTGSRLRPYHDEHTCSRLITEVKHRRARRVLGWGTAWEHLVP